MSQTVPSSRSARPDAVAVVRASREIDIATAPALRRALRECVEARYPTIHVDMSQVSFMDCSGIGAVIAARRRAAAAGVSVAIVNPSPAARTVLELAGVCVLLVADVPASDAAYDRRDRGFPS